jgi:hypothetical protein
VPTPDHPLARAFASFTEAASSLERTYGQLQSQVAQLRQELEATNRDLAKSLEENRRIREGLRQILGGLTLRRAGDGSGFSPFPKVVVLSPLEIPSMVPVQSLGTVR